jgi:3-hydroxyacyl-CoA dehydrogenase
MSIQKVGVVGAGQMRAGRKIGRRFASWGFASSAPHRLPTLHWTPEVAA